MELLDLSQGRFYLIMAPRAVRRAWMTHLITRLAIAGPVCVLDGGNRFDARLIARQLRQQGRAFYQPLQRIRVARAFTCHQMAVMLDQTDPQDAPIVILDLLNTFVDESLAFERRYRLLENALQRIQTLAQRTPVVVSAPLSDSEDALLKLLEASADQIWRFESEAPPTQPKLF